MQFKPDFLIIPYIAVENPNLQPLDRILYGVVYYFEKMREGKCIASNETLREYAQAKNINSIQHSLERLEKEGYIKRIYKDENRKIRKEIKCKIVFRVLSNDNTVLSNKHTVCSNKHSKVCSNDNHISNTNISKSNKEKQIAKQSFAFNLNPLID